MTENGFIKLHRSLLSWEWYDDVNTKIVFLHLLLTVNYEESQWHGKTIQRGQRVCSVATLAKETRLSVRNVRTAINHLISTNEVTSEVTNAEGHQIALYTVKNYGMYQDIPTNEMTNEPTNERQMTDKRTTNDRHIYKKNKEEKEEEEYIYNNINIISAELKNSSTEETEQKSANGVISIILNDKTEHYITQAEVDTWQSLYEGIDVITELKKIKAWCIANDKNRKTKKGVNRFINSWLSRAQDKAPIQHRNGNTAQNNPGDWTAQYGTSNPFEAMRMKLQQQNNEYAGREIIEQ